MGHIKLKDFTKRPAERRIVEIDFKRALPTGVSLTGHKTGFPKVTLVSDGSDKTGDIFVTASDTVDGTIGRIKVHAGVDEECYQITMVVQTSDEDIQGDVLMIVENAGKE